MMLALLPMKQFAQHPFTISETSLEFDITTINTFDERIYFIYNLINDPRFNVVNSENDGVFIISTDPAFKGMNLKTTFADFQNQTAIQFSRMDKEQASETAIEYKASLPNEITHSLMMDVYIKSRQNNLCNTADPFCTDNGMYQFPAGVDAGSGEDGPDYDCLHSTPNPAWYFMRIGTPGNINIYMYSTPGVDIDFCCWGPFDNPESPCPQGLTSDKVVSCSYSGNATETCVIPSDAQTGEYYILVITNYSNQTCDIHFSKTGGNGTTDCGIMPPLVDNDGPYCVGETIHLSGNAQQEATYSWSGPGGWTANGQNVTIPNCTMAMSGIYTCTIRVGTQTNSATTEVIVYANPIANFTANATCVGNPTRFTNSSTTNPANQAMEYRWNFGDGNTSTQQSPTHQYAAAGEYNVTLTASCGEGTCTSTKTQRVTVYPDPIAEAGEDQTVIYNGTATLSGSGGNGNFNYHWEPADKVVSPNAQTTQTVALQQSTTFTLTVTQPQGNCSSTDQVSVLVSGSNMTATASASPNSICLGDSSQLRATAVGGTGNYTYSWTPTIGLSSPIIANPTANPTETTTYTCTVSDGESTQTISTTVTVNSPEYEEETQYICPGDSYTFYEEEYSEAGDYDFVTTTAQGCEKTITLHLRHYPSYSNAHTTTDYICYGSGYNFHGHYYNAPGTYQENLHTTLGCDSIVWLNLIVNYPDVSDTIVTDQCDEYVWQFGWNGESYTFTEPGDYTKTINTTLGCDSTVTLHLFMDYGPTFPCVEGNSWVVGGSEFQYTIENYWIDAPGTHTTQWYINTPANFNKWEVKPYDDGDKCHLYIYTFELDSIELCAKTVSSGVCGTCTRSKWIHCSYHDVSETTTMCQAEIYPNPNDGNMTLSFDNMMGEVVIKVYNITGELMDHFTVYNGFGHQTHTYQPNRLSEGIYFFQLSNKDGMLTKKVIIID